MAKVKCEYCGNFIEDTLEKCDVCGATNANHQRVSKGTPQTIQELKQWYIDRKLPPEETTRFFIGKNITEPKAFGIYEEGGCFVVYKNKANGERAIRYEGTDEAYAVNELYLRLKEEILHQKNQNLKRRQSSYTESRRSRNAASRRRRTPAKLTKLFAVIIALFFTAPILNILFVALLLKLPFGYNVSNYYYSDSKTLYYQVNDPSNNQKIDWWIYNPDTNEWSVFKEDTDKKYFPENMSPSHIQDNIWELAETIGEEYDDINIENSRAFIDAGHHKHPSSAYYYHNDTLYYFLDDPHSTSASNNNTGWYIYKNNKWEYYCDVDNKDTLPEDLWYDEDEYYAGTEAKDIYIYDDDLSEDWIPFDFKDTSWYHSYERNEQAYQEKLEEDRNNYDNDNDYDYDWDSDDDWDSGDSDWDSDW